MRVLWVITRPLELRPTSLRWTRSLVHVDQIKLYFDRFKTFPEIVKKKLFLTASRVYKMSSLESSSRGALAATPDPATFYRRKYFCASPAGGGKGKRHPGKAILAGKNWL